MRVSKWGALGLLPWFVAQFIALGIGGAGHGWIAPFYFTIPLFLLYPLVFIRAFSRVGTWKVDAAILVIAAVLDLLLLRNLFFLEYEYFLRMWNDARGVVALWFGLWAAWQVLAITTLLRKRRVESELGTPGPIRA
jgi:hypothetical protein